MFVVKRKTLNNEIKTFKSENSRKSFRENGQRCCCRPKSDARGLLLARCTKTVSCCLVGRLKLRAQDLNHFDENSTSFRIKEAGHFASFVGRSEDRGDELLWTDELQKSEQN
jgi:hypothetical protein